MPEQRRALRARVLARARGIRKFLVWANEHGRVSVVERELRVFRSFDEADRADDDYYASLSAAECLDITLTLIAVHRENTGEAGSRFERVYRVIQLASG